MKKYELWVKYVRWTKVKESDSWRYLAWYARQFMGGQRTFIKEIEVTEEN